MSSYISIYISNLQAVRTETLDTLETLERAQLEAELEQLLAELETHEQATTSQSYHISW